MDKIVFHDKKFDDDMVASRCKKAVLLVDNASNHVWLDMVERLAVTRVLPLPPNTTTRFQPINVGIIKSFKCQYRKLMMHRQIEDYDVGKVMKLDIYDAIFMVEKAWMEGAHKASSQTTRGIVALVHMWKIGLGMNGGT